MEVRMSKKTLLLATAMLLAALVLPSGPGSLAGEGWFVALAHRLVAPTQRSDVTQLFDAGVVQTDGFRDIVISFGGEFKEGLPSGGRVGAILIPDHEIADYLLRNEGVFVFPTEIEYRLDGSMQGNFFMSKSTQTKVAFPRYRVYLYNETTSGASMSVFIYRSR
jgi:hypothetical protein